MPFSKTKFDNVLLKVLKHINPKSFLDIGSGAGKYGKMIKQLNPNVLSVAIEVDKKYINKFKLKSIYDNVLNISATKLIQPKYYGIEFDTIMFGDVIEHLKKADGINLLNFLIYRCKWVIIVFPHKYLQNSVQSHSSEAHISIWHKTDFGAFEKTKMYKRKQLRLVILKGYLKDNHYTIKDINKIIEKC